MSSDYAEAQDEQFYEEHGYYPDEAADHVPLPDDEVRYPAWTERDLTKGHDE